MRTHHVWMMMTRMFSLPYLCNGADVTTTNRSHVTAFLPHQHGMDPQALFADAVRAVLQRWTALNLAVTNDWGDGRSEEKRDALFVQIISGFPAGKKAPDPTELETFLDQFMEQNFSTDADDESPYEVICLCLC
eukprot:1010060-Rhodomonas_salina.1